MIELLSSFTTAQIIIFIVLLAVAFKKVADFLDWMRDKIKKRDNKHQETISRDQKIDQQLAEFPFLGIRRKRKFIHTQRSRLFLVTVARL